MMKGDERAARTLWFISTVLFALSFLVGLFWWVGVWHRGLLRKIWVPEAIPWILGFVGIQLLVWILIVLAILRTSRLPSSLVQGMLVVLAAGILLGSSLYFVTPALGLLLTAPFLVGLLVLVPLSGRYRPV